MSHMDPTIKNLTEITDTREEAVAIRYLLAKVHDIADIFNVCGWLDKHSPRMAIAKLGQFENRLQSVWQGPTNIPRNTVEDVLRLADALLRTHGVEGFVMENKDGDRVDVQYCNTGDSYGNTLVHCEPGRGDGFMLTTWADIIEQYESKGYKQLESYEI